MKVVAKSRNVVLEITGRAIGKRFEVVVNGQSVALRGVEFLYLFQLARRAWLGNEPHWPRPRYGDNDARYIYRLKAELTEAEVAASLPINWKSGFGYLLELSPKQISFHQESLKDYPDHRVTEMLVTDKRSVVFEAGASWNTAA